MNYILQSLAVFKKTNKQNIELTEIFIRALKLDLKALFFGEVGNSAARC